MYFYSNLKSIQLDDMVKPPYLLINLSNHDAFDAWTCFEHRNDMVAFKIIDRPINSLVHSINDDAEWNQIDFDSKVVC